MSLQYDPNENIGFYRTQTNNIKIYNRKTIVCKGCRVTRSAIQFRDTGTAYCRKCARMKVNKLD